MASVYRALGSFCRHCLKPSHESAGITQWLTVTMTVSDQFAPGIRETGPQERRPVGVTSDGQPIADGSGEGQQAVVGDEQRIGQWRTCRHWVREGRALECQSGPGTRRRQCRAPCPPGVLPLLTSMVTPVSIPASIAALPEPMRQPPSPDRQKLDRPRCSTVPVRMLPATLQSVPLAHSPLPQRVLSIVAVLPDTTVIPTQ